MEKEWEREWCEYWFRLILENPEKPWNWYGISENPTITWDIIRANPEKPWNWGMISGNPMTKAKQEFIREKRQAYYKPIVENILDKYNCPYDLVAGILQCI